MKTAINYPEFLPSTIGMPTTYDIAPNACPFPDNVLSPVPDCNLAFEDSTVARIPVPTPPHENAHFLQGRWSYDYRTGYNHPGTHKMMPQQPASFSHTWTSAPSAPASPTSFAITAPAYYPQFSTPPPPQPPRSSHACVTVPHPTAYHGAMPFGFVPSHESAQWMASLPGAHEARPPMAGAQVVSSRDISDSSSQDEHTPNNKRLSNASPTPDTPSYDIYPIVRESKKPSNRTPRRYKCQVCVKRFTRPSSLATHMHSHTGEKPYECTIDGCGRRFSVVSNLRRHAKIHNTQSHSNNSSSSSSSIKSTSSTGSIECTGSKKS